MHKNWLVGIFIFFGAISAWSQTRTLDIGIDTDDDPTTGCTWNLTDGSFVQGIEGILRTTYSTGASPQVLETAYLRCSDGIQWQSSTITSFPWPIGLNLGANGEDIIESSMPLSYLGITGRIRMVVETRSDTEFDQLRTTLGGDPIIFTFPIPLPTLQTSVLILLVVLVLATSIWFMRRNRKKALQVLIVLSAFSLMAMTCSILLDGQIDDWSGLASLTEDPSGDTLDPTLDITTFFACQGANDLYFRIDVSEAENQAPTVEDQTVNLLEDSQLLITLTATDPDGQALDFEIVGPPSQGTLSSITVTGNETAEVTYTPDGDFFGPDSFSFRVFDGYIYSSHGTVSIQVDPVNDEPSFTSGGDVTVQEDAGPQKQAEPRSIPWATDLSPGPANEASQVLTFQMTGNTNSALFASQPTVDGVTGELSFTPADNEFGSSDITLYLRDDAGTTNGGDDSSPSVIFTITVTSQNDDPTANDDSATVDEDSVDIALDVLANDTTDPDVGETLTITAVGTPDQGGSVSIDAGTSLLYSPLADFFGTESFTYTISDGNGGSDTATVIVTVENINDDPTAMDDSFSVDEDSIDNPLDTLANDSIDPDSDETLTITTLGTPDQGGSVSISGGNSVLYSPAADFFGSETFTYNIDDGNGGTDTATVTVTVTNVNDDPTANDDSFNVNEDSSANALDLLANDVQLPDSGETLTINAVGTPDQGGSVVITGGGSGVSYTPAADFNGQETFTYDLADGNGGSDTATVTVDVQSINDVPSFTKGTDPTVLEDAGPQSVPNWATSISPGPTNESGQALTFNVTGNTNAALFASQPSVDATGALSFETAADANGSADITITLSDDGGTANGGVNTSPAQTFTISVTPVNDAPSFTSGGTVSHTGAATPQTEAGWATSISPGPADESSQVLAFNITGNSNPSIFSAGPTVNALTGDLSYTPVNGASGTATVTLTLSDDGGTANGGIDTSPGITFDIQITAQNQEPTFTAGGNNTVLEDAGPQTVNAWATSMDDGDGGTQILTFNVTGNTNSSLFSAGPSINATTGNLTYTPATDANGSATITVELQDNGGTSGGGDDTSPPSSFTITVTAVNDAPSFSSGADETVLEDAGAQVVVAWATSISAGPADESGQTVSFNITNNTNPTLFSAGPAVASDGTLTYTPAADTFGSATLTLELMDNGGTANAGVDTSPSIMFDINVTSVNDPPTVNGETFDGVSFAAPIGNTTLEFSNAESVSTPHVYVGGDVLANDTDPDTATLSISTYDAASVQGGTVSMNTTTGEFTYQPPLGFEGADSFTYTVTDGTTPTVGTVNLTVSEMVWYLDNSAAAPGTGRSNAPFDTMASFNAVQGNGGATDPAAGDTIFLFETMITYQSGITLLDNQHLIGQGRDLVVNGTTLVTATTNPALTNASGDVVTLANDNIVEGLTLLPVASAGVAKILIIPEKAETTEKFGTETILRHLTINPDGGSNGIEFLAIPSGTLTVHNVTIQGLAGCTGSGILGDSSNVTLDFDDLSLQSPLGKGLDFFGMSGSLTATNVNISTDGLAVSIQGDNPNITFNGTSSITQNTGGGALDATLTGGTLNFGSIPISISNLDAFQNAVVLDAGGNDVVLAMSNLTIDASSGNDALVLTDLSASSMVSIGTTSLAITGAGNRGIVLTNNETTINFPVGSTISNTTGTAFEITGGAGTVTYPSALTNSAGRVVNIDGTTGGTITFLGTVTEQTGGLGVRVANSAGTITFADLNLGTSGSPLTSDAILLDTNTGIINLNDISVFTNLARGIVASGGSPTLNITTAIVNTTNALGLDLANAAMAANFANVSVNNGAGGGINLNNNTGTTTIGLLTIANTGGTGLNATNAGTVNVTDASSSIATANGPAIVVNPTTVGMAFANVSSTNSATTGISLTGLSGSLIMNSGSISGSTGTAFNVSGGNGTISYSGGITNTAGRLATIVNRTGGTITLSGALVDTGATGLLIQNNSSGGPAVIFSGTVDIANSTGTAITSQTNTGATISFADLDITNTTSNQTGLFVSSSGTFNSTTGIINTGSGRAVDIDNTNLGMILRSVSSNGGNNPGIDLNTTTGSFLVNGDGSNTSQGGNGTGGTIANKGGGDSTTAGIGVLLNNTVGVVLRRMQLNDHVNWAIYGTSVNGLGLEYLTINGTNGNNAGPDEGAIFLTNLTGSTSTTTFESIDVEGGLEDNIRIVNSTGSLDDFQLLNSRIGLNNNALGNDGVVVETSASATATLTVTGNTFVGARLDMFQLNTIGSGDIDLTFNNNVCANGHGNIVSGGGGITIGGGSASASGNFTFNITGNQISGALGNALFVGKDLGTAVFSGTISGNTIGIANNVSSGSTQASGIVVRAQDGGQVSSTISGNSIYGFNEYGIHCNARDGNGDMSVIVQGNTIEDNGTFALYGIQVLSGATASDTNELCATVGGAGALQNSITSDAFPIADIRIRQRFSTVMNIIGYAGGAADAAALQTYIQSQNAGTPTVSASIISIGGSCTF